MPEKDRKIYGKVLEKLDKGDNLFLTGAAGVGKSYFVNNFKKFCKYSGRDVTVTSSTGISATHIGGMTIHRLLKFGAQSNPEYVQNMMEGRYWGLLCRDVSRLDVLVIDEISMIRSDTLDLIDMILRQASFHQTKPFGGVKVLLVGDFLQMPPVVKTNENMPYPWAFQSKSWNNGNIKVLPLSKVMRQDNQDFIKVLHNVRLGRCTDNVLATIEECMNRPSSDKAVKFVPTNNEARSINLKKLATIDAEEKSFAAKIDGKNEHYIKQIKDDTIALENLVLKIGARVMTIKNDPDGYFTNGSLGEVVAIGPNSVSVKLDTNGIVVNLEEATWERKDIHDRVLATFKQIPLRLAYAITIHKSQGMTLDSAEIDCYNIFSDGQLYVSMSRVRSKEGLILRGFRREHIRASKAALNYYRSNGCI